MTSFYTLAVTYIYIFEGVCVKIGWGVLLLSLRLERGGSKNLPVSRIVTSARHRFDPVQKPPPPVAGTWHDQLFRMVRQSHLPHPIGSAFIMENGFPTILLRSSTRYEKTYTWWFMCKKSTGVYLQNVCKGWVTRVSYIRYKVPKSCHYS